MVIGVDGFFASLLSSQDFNGTVRDDLVGVHVGLGTGTGLPDNEWEVIDELEGSNLGSGLLDCFTNLGVCVALASPP
jgi:hypothetical protein